MKSRNLTQIILRNDPINRRMQGFSFQIDEDKNWSSRCDFFLLLRSNFDFKHSLDAEMHQEYSESNGSRNDALNKENLMSDHVRFFPSRRTSFKETIFYRGRWMKRSITIYDRDQAAFRESSLPLDDRPIISERLRCEFIL